MTPTPTPAPPSTPLRRQEVRGLGESSGFSLFLADYPDVYPALSAGTIPQEILDTFAECDIELPDDARLVTVFPGFEWTIENTPYRIQAAAGEVKVVGIQNLGRPAKGDSLIVIIQRLERVQEIRFLGADGVHYLVKPEADGNELIAARIGVHNDEATRVLLTVDKESAELRGFEGDERYAPLGMYDLDSLMDTHVRMVEDTHPSENRFVPFLAGPISVGCMDGLPEDHSVEGWMVFEVPRGVKLKEMRWGTGTVFATGQARDELGK